MVRLSLRSGAARRLLARVLLLVGVGLLPLTGCFGPLARRLADREVYPIVAAKQQQVFGHTLPFTIETTTTALTARVREQAGTSTDMMTTQGLTISLNDALALAVENNWAYQTAKEDVYLSALDLTAARHEFSPIFSGAVSAQAVREADSGGGVEHFGTVASDLAVTKLFATGARVTVGLSNNFLRLGGQDSATGELSASLVQPLLRGAGTLVTLENLRQSERDVVYAVRSFSRFQKDFIIARIEDYYNLLKARDEIDNEFQAYQRLIVTRERAQAFEQAGRMAAFEVDQALQNEIDARNRWVTAKTDYALKLDQFKLNLGLPPELNIQPDPRELDSLRQTGLIELKYDLATAQNLALRQRLDYLTVQQQAEDAGRKVKVAENNLLPDLNVSADLAVPDAGRNQPLNLDWRRRSRTLGAELKLPLDRKSERNTYRRTTIDEAQATRDATQKRDRVLAEVRSAFQATQEARQSYEIQLDSLKLAARRVDNVRMLLEAGRENVNIRDQLDAEEALRDAQNAVTAALVSYTIDRLSFYNAIETLEIDERGMWHEPTQTKP